MTRIAPIDPKVASGPAREIFDGPLKGKHFNIFRSMAASPAALSMYLAMGKALEQGSLTPREREVIQLAVGEANQCNYCVSAHTVIGKGAGLSEAQTVEARRGRMADEKLNALARFALAIHEKRGFVSDADVSEFRAAGYGDAHIAETVAVYALATFTNYFNHVNDTAVDFPAVPRIG